MEMDVPAIVKLSKVAYIFDKYTNNLHIGWECKSGLTSTIDTCTPICGDGRRFDPYEMCDDGNNINGDGCSSTCSGEDDWECHGGDSQNPDICTCEPGGEKAIFSETWEEIYII